MSLPKTYDILIWVMGHGPDKTFGDDVTFVDMVVFLINWILRIKGEKPIPEEEIRSNPVHH